MMVCPAEDVGMSSARLQRINEYLDREVAYNK